MILKKVINLVRNFGLMLGCYILFFIALGLLSIIFPGLDLESYQQTDLNRLLEEAPFKLVILAVVLAPLIEEGMFRTLIKPTPNELIFFLCIWLFVITLAVIPENVNWMIKYGFLLLFFILSFIFLREFIPGSWQKNLCRLLSRYYRVVWIITAIIFGMVHIFNYVEGFELNFVLMLLIFPRIIAGYFFGKIKVENKGLVWPMAMHAMNNGLVFIVLLPRILFSS